MSPDVARAMWMALEPYHAVVYFAPESRQLYADAGLKGYWMGYFASRSAAMGPVPPEIVMATFYNFAESMVRRAIPDAWWFSTVERVLEARLQVAAAATKRYPGTLDQIEQAGKLAERAARAAAPQGRPLFAAHAALLWPEDPHLRLWHAATLLREHRGDAHVAILLAEGIDGLESHLLAAAAGRIDATSQKQHRGYSEDEWEAAAERLRARGLLDHDASFTHAGAAVKEHIELRTDELSVAPYEVLGEDGCARLAQLMLSVVDATAVPTPNAMGLPKR